jgi:hypothetical protein
VVRKASKGRVFVEWKITMGHFVWIFAALAAVGGLIGLTSLDNHEPRSTKPESVEAEAPGGRAPQRNLDDFGSSGNAISVAAFGLSALQPDTYNGELVLEIIDASHLDEEEKDSLAAELAAAEAGRADLDEVLEDVRVALALE